MQQVAHGFWALFRWHSVVMSAFVWQLVADVTGHWPPQHLLDIHNPHMCMLHSSQLKAHVTILSAKPK